jgi:hypothetical protein
VLTRSRQHRISDIGLPSVVVAKLNFGVTKNGSACNLQALRMLLAPTGRSVL